MDTKPPTAVLTAHHVRFSWRLSSRGTDHNGLETAAAAPQCEATYPANFLSASPRELV